MITLPFNYLSKHWRLIFFSIIAITLLFLFNEATRAIWARWGEERYSHAPFVLALAIYLIWIKRHELIDTNKKAWIGLPIVIIAGLTMMVGELSAIWTLVQYGMFFSLFGLMWSMLGVQTLRIIVPFIHVLLVIPLPYMLDVMLSGKFQLMSSQLGVEMVRLMDIPVFREGNIIDLGVYKLQVVEACSGLNYTYPLMTISLMMAYMYKAPFIARALLFFTSIPISIVMNSFRIAVVAFLVNRSGIEAAEGFMHYFEGWVIFFLCIATLLFEVIIMNKIMKRNVSLADSFDYLEDPLKNQKIHRNSYINISPIAVCSVLILLTAVSTLSIHHRQEVIPDRLSFNQYPLEIEGWKGKTREFEQKEKEILGLKDYFLASYTKDSRQIDVYFGYTDSQRNGFVPHSPKACIPGGGWEIAEAKIHEIELNPDKKIEITRLLITKGETKMLVYYWFHQRGRDLSNEFPMKFALLYDSITMNRTDGALVRFISPVGKSESEEEADRILSDFIQVNYPVMADYIPH